MIRNFYEILGIKENASITEIKTAYRKLSKKFHPDVNEGDKFFEERFKEINEAYETLSDQKKKINYDSSHGYSRQQKSTTPPPPNEPVKPPPPPPTQPGPEPKSDFKSKYKTHEERESEKTESFANASSRFAIWVVIIVVAWIFGLVLRKSSEKKSTPISYDIQPRKPLFKYDLPEVKKPKWADSISSFVNESNSLYLNITLHKWEGYSYQPNVNESFRINLSYDTKSNNLLVEYPTLGCSGFWTVFKKSATEIFFYETITTGTNNCTNGGIVKLKKIANITMEYSFYWPTADRLDSSGTLDRKN